MKYISPVFSSTCSATCLFGLSLMIPACDDYNNIDQTNLDHDVLYDQLRDTNEATIDGNFSWLSSPSQSEDEDLRVGQDPAECWKVVGWTFDSSTPVHANRPTLVGTSCFTIPPGYRFFDVTHKIPGASNPDREIHLLIDKNDSRIDNQTNTIYAGFWFASYEGQGTNRKPKILHTYCVNSQECVNSQPARNYPPRQGWPWGEDIRIRSIVDNWCLVAPSSNGGDVVNAPCDENDPNQEFELEDGTQTGLGRIRSPQSSMCLYNRNFQFPYKSVRAWGCWSDPNMDYNITEQHDASGEKSGYFWLRHRAGGSVIYLEEGNEDDYVVSGGLHDTDPRAMWALDIVR